MAARNGMKKGGSGKRIMDCWMKNRSRSAPERMRPTFSFTRSHADDFQWRVHAGRPDRRSRSRSKRASRN